MSSDVVLDRRTSKEAHQRQDGRRPPWNPPVTLHSGSAGKRFFERRDRAPLRQMSVSTVGEVLNGVDVSRPTGFQYGKTPPGVGYPFHIPEPVDPSGRHSR